MTPQEQEQNEAALVANEAAALKTYREKANEARRELARAEALVRLAQSKYETTRLEMERRAVARRRAGLIDTSTSEGI
jgi:hypothetical protein